jgi:hypothetical protein
MQANLKERHLRVSIVFLTALFLAACNPAAEAPEQTSAATDQAAAPSAANADAVALQGALASGQWFERVEEGTFAAGFGVPQSEYQFSIACTAGSGAIGVTSGHELAPDQATTIRLITATQSLELPARSFNEGLPSITAEIADNDPVKPLLIGMLGAPTDRFAVDAGGTITVFPWHESIARTLIACR